eukprot:TRINITY_DN62295_c0_g1_i1.p1 TRINITY_DN62295_c0_g1~~TRINITY_DN62295_c0_g1_i1.p1  ORF type:complete len:192 (+),score=33.69 TRINITY_DN62295_c0_g1_i1:113-688(+)
MGLCHSCANEANGVREVDDTQASEISRRNIEELSHLLHALQGVKPSVNGSPLIGNVTIINQVHILSDRQNGLGVTLNSDMAGAFRQNNDAASGTGNVGRLNGALAYNNMPGALQGNNDALSGTGNVERLNGAIAQTGSLGLSVPVAAAEASSAAQADPLASPPSGAAPPPSSGKSSEGPKAKSLLPLRRSA